MRPSSSDLEGAWKGPALAAAALPAPDRFLQNFHNSSKGLQKSELEESLGSTDLHTGVAHYHRTVSNRCMQAQVSEWTGCSFIHGFVGCYIFAKSEKASKFHGATRSSLTAVLPGKACAFWVIRGHSFGFKSGIRLWKNADILWCDYIKVQIFQD